MDDDGQNWQNEEIKRLEGRLADLIVENQDLKTNLEKKHYDQVYRDNDRMVLELRNMYLL